MQEKRKLLWIMAFFMAAAWIAVLLMTAGSLH